MRNQLVPITICILFSINACCEEEPVKPNPYLFDATEYVLISTVTFEMGNSADTLVEYEGEQPVHKVTLTHPYLMSRTEVTQAQYEALMGSNPSHFIGANNPVEMVRWYDAIEYCNRRSEQEELTKCYSNSGNGIVCDFGANGYRLPTEAEWEYACRRCTKTDFYTGNMTHKGATPLDPALDKAGWYKGNSQESTHQVGQKEANGFGLYDMHGNVEEFCWDWYYDYPSEHVTDPIGPGTGMMRMSRGGSWASDAKYCRSAARNLSYLDVQYNTCGFRVVRTY